MARSRFGGTTNDIALDAVAINGHQVLALVPVTLTFWDSQVAGDQWDDLVLDGAPVSSIPVDSSGMIPEFQGPDDVEEMWVDGGGGRALLKTSDRLPGPVGPDGPTGAPGGSDAATASWLSSGPLTRDALTAALSGLNVLAYGTVTPGGDILTALNAAIDAAKRTAAIAPPRVYVPYCDAGYLLSDKPTYASGVTVEGMGFVTLKLSVSRTRMHDLTGLSDVTIRGFTFDLNGNITGAGAYLPATAVDCEVDFNRWINTKTTSRAVTNKVLTSNVVTLTLDNTGANPITVGQVVPVYGVNGTSGLAYADAGVFNTSSATITAATATTVSYAKTNANVASTAVTSGWVTNGVSTVSIYAINCESAVRPKITRNLMTGIRAGIRLYEGVTEFLLEGNHFVGWGDRAIFVLGSASGNASGKILHNTIEAPSQFFGDPHQPIAFQGVAGFWHDGIECAHNEVYGATSGGVLVGHHTGRSNNDLLGGTADAISFHHTKNLHLHHNKVYNSGEVGFTVSNDCTQFNIHDNTVDGSNSVAYALDWGTGASFIGIGSAFHSNTSINASQERGQASTGNSPRTGVRSAFWLAGPTGVHIHDNVAHDNQGTPTQTSAYYIKDATSGITIGKTSIQGGTTLLLNASSSYTGTIDFYTAGTGTAPNVQAFTTAGTFTWTKPAGAVRVRVIPIAAGNGAGSGRRGAAASVRAGGSGGAPGSRLDVEMMAADLGATETVVVGAGGAGGAAVTTDNTDGNAGALGGASSFGTTGASTRWVTTPLGGAGSGGTAGAGTGGTAAAPGCAVGSAASGTGAAGATSNNGTGRASQLSAGGGASGAGLTTGNAEAAGGTGSPAHSGVTTAATAGTAGGGNGANGAAPAPNTRGGGGGGAGGGSSLTTAGGAGGNGGAPGGGGGGGGASVNGNNSGAGGNGPDGAVYVITYFS